MLNLEKIHKSYGTTQVLRGLDLQVNDGEILCLLGPSGCGKSTALRLIAGLEKPDAGTISLNGQPLVNVPVHERGFGLMFQDFALFPHLNVFDNVAFGLRMHHTSQADIQRRTAEALELVRLTGFEKRDVSDLSGGEKQRVALARSLAPQPKLLMLDEPLGSLDAALRTQLIGEIREIIKTTKLTAIYVTHDRGEAFSVSDRLGVMNNGKIERIDTPDAVYNHPETLFTASFLGFRNIFTASEIAKTSLLAAPPSTDGHLLFHPSGITSAAGQGIPMQVTEAIFEGERYRLLAARDGLVFEINTPATSKRLKAGDTVTVQIDPAWIQVIR